MNNNISPDGIFINKKTPWIFIFAVVLSISMTALPLYTIKYINLDDSLKLMFILEFVFALLIYGLYFRGGGDIKNKKSMKISLMVLFVLSLVQIFSYYKTVYTQDITPTRLDFWPIFLLVVVIPFYEEVIYRGCLFFGLNYFINNVLVSSLITSLVFSLMHTQYNSIDGYAIIFLMSMLLVYVRVKTHGLHYPMLIHSCMNAIVIILNTQVLYR